MLRTRRIELLRPGEILAEIRRCPIAYWPLGLIEWHGPQNPMGCDALNAEEVCRRAAEQTGGLVLPTLYVGTERENSPEMLKCLGFRGDEYIVGMDYPHNCMKSAYYSEEVFAILIRDGLRAYIAMGFRFIVLLSGHGATNQGEVLRRLAIEFTANGPARVILEYPTVTGAQGRGEGDHGARVETSIMMALQPDGVDLGELPPPDVPLRNTEWGIVDVPTFSGRPTPEFTVHEPDDPRQHSSPEDGQRLLRLASEQLATRVMVTYSQP